MAANDKRIDQLPAKATPAPNDLVVIEDAITQEFRKTTASAMIGAGVSGVVNLTDNQTVAGIKTFTSSPILPTPTTASQAANKSYVDSVASSTGKALFKTVGFSDADYIVDGVADNVQLQQAIDDLTAAGGGTLFVKKGLYDIQKRVWILGSNITIRGAGRGATVFRLANNANQEIWLVGNGFSGDTAAGDPPGVVICNDVSFYDFSLDGNKANQVPASQFDSVKYGNSATRNLLRYRSDAQTSYGGTVQNVHAYNGKQNGLSCESHALGAFIDCFAENCDQSGIWTENTSNWNLTNIYTRNNGQDTAIGGSGIRVLSSGGIQVNGLDSKGDRGPALTFLHVGDSSFTGVSAYRSGWQGGANDTATSSISMSDVDNVSGANVNIFGSQGHGFELNGTRKSNFANFTFRRNGQKTDNTYSDVWITFAGGSSVVNNNFANFTFNNENPSFYTNKAKYNIGSNAPQAHTGNKFTNLSLGSPSTAKIYQITFGNTFYSTEGVNPIGFYNYGYADPVQVINPGFGSFLSAAGYSTETTINITDGLYAGQEFTFRFNQDVGNKQITNWGTNVKWSNRPPVFSGVPNSDDLMTFVWDGTYWYGLHNSIQPRYYSLPSYATNPQSLDTSSYDIINATGYDSSTQMNLTNGRRSGQQFTLIFSQDSGNKQLTWSSNVKWVGGRTPTLSGLPNTSDVFTFLWDGSIWLGRVTSNEKRYNNYGYFDPSPYTINPNLYDIIEGTGYGSVTQLNMNDGRNKGQQFTLIFNQDVGNKQLTYGTNVQWSDGATPVFSGNANTSDILTFTWNGTKWVGYLGAAFTQSQADARYLQLTGGTVTGVLNVKNNDSYFGTGAAGGTGGIVHIGSLGTNDGYVEAQSSNTNADLYLRAKGTGIVRIQNPVNLNSQTISSVADPVSAQDAATKNYVDSVATGLDVKASVRAATTANITLSGTQTIDGVAVVAGNRVLVKNQTTASQNGIYVVASGAWARSTDADTNAEVTSGMFTFVTEGTANAGRGFVLTTPDPIILGTTALSFTQFSSSANGVNSVTAGDSTITIGGTATNPTVAVSSSFSASKKSIMTQQATQTTSFTASAGNFYPINASTGNVTVTLPTSTAGQEIQFKKLDANANTGATSGIVFLTGTINGNSGASIPLRKINQGKQALADGSGGWSLVLGDLDITSLQATTLEPGTVQLAGDLTGTATAPLLANTSNVQNIVQIDSIPLIIALG